MMCILPLFAQLTKNTPHFSTFFKLSMFNGIFIHFLPLNPILILKILVFWLNSLHFVTF